MTESHWKKLRRGALIKHRGTDRVFQVHDYSTREDKRVVMVIASATIDKFHEWDEITENNIVIDERGVPVKIMENACMLCVGEARATSMDGVVDNCPRCGGTRVEPDNLQESIINIRVFFPEKATVDAVAMMSVNGNATLNAAQIIAAMQAGIKIMEEHGVDVGSQIAVGLGSKMVN